MVSTVTAKRKNSHDKQEQLGRASKRHAVWSPPQPAAAPAGCCFPDLLLLLLPQQPPGRLRCRGWQLALPLCPAWQGVGCLVHAAAHKGEARKRRRAGFVHSPAHGGRVAHAWCMLLAGPHLTSVFTASFVQPGGGMGKLRGG